jgi:membrane-bound lytic murein transglycosylase D
MSSGRNSNKTGGPGLASLITVFLLIFACGYGIIRVYVLPPSLNTISYSNNNFRHLGLNIPTDLNFCGERIPSNNFEIAKNLDREFFTDRYWQINSASLFHKAQKWFPYIEPILKREGVPDDFKYVAVIESHLSNIVSPAGATGFWQLVPASARNYGLEVNENIDERYHVEKATVAACKLFKEAHAVFKNWTLAAAAYNRGIAGIQTAMRDQKADSYYQLLLNKETGSFVYRVLAYKTLFSSPAHFGLKKKKWNYFPMMVMQAMKVDTSIKDIAYLAKRFGCNKATIRLYNPWLLKDELKNPGRKTYIFRIPRNPRMDYSSYLMDLNGENGDLNMDPESPPSEEAVISIPLSDTLK